MTLDGLTKPCHGQEVLGWLAVWRGVLCLCRRRKGIMFGVNIHVALADCDGDEGQQGA